MATYVSPLLNTLAKGRVAGEQIATLIGHIVAGTGGYPTMAQVTSFDLGVTTPQVFTIVLTVAIPAAQVARYNLTQTS